MLEERKLGLEPKLDGGADQWETKTTFLKTKDRSPGANTLDAICWRRTYDNPNIQQGLSFITSRAIHIHNNTIKCVHSEEQSCSGPTTCPKTSA